MLLLLALLLVDPPTILSPGANQPHLAAHDDGFHAAFIKDGNIWYAGSADKGKTWSPSVLAIDARGKGAGGMQRGPRIAVDAKKTIYITAPLTYDEAELSGKKYPTRDLYLAVSTDGGRSFSKPVQINDAPKKAPEALHWLAAAPTGEVYVAWLDLRQRDQGQDLAWVKIGDQGKTIGRNEVVAGPLCECCAPGLTVDAKGNPLVLYREGGKTNRSIFLSTNFKAPVKVNSVDTKIDACPMDAPQVAVSGDGKSIATAWMDFRAGANVRRVHWSLGGKPETPVSDAPGTQGHPSLAFDADGVVWCAFEDTRRGLNAQAIFAADWKSRKNIAVSAENEGKCGYPTVASAGGTLGVVYESGGGIAFRVIAP